MATLTTKTHIKLTTEELLDILKREFDLTSDSDVTYEIVSLPEADVWFYVPENWDALQCPTAMHEGAFVEVVYKDRECDTGYTHEWGASWQHRAYNPIVKYRPIKKL